MINCDVHPGVWQVLVVTHLFIPTLNETVASQNFASLSVYEEPANSLMVIVSPRIESTLLYVKVKPTVSIGFCVVHFVQVWCGGRQKE